MTGVVPPSGCHWLLSNCHGGLPGSHKTEVISTPETGCGSGIRTRDLMVMSHARYRPALSRDTRFSRRRNVRPERQLVAFVRITHVQRQARRAKAPDEHNRRLGNNRWWMDLLHGCGAKGRARIDLFGFSIRRITINASLARLPAGK